MKGVNEDQATKSMRTAVSMYHAKDVLTKETEMMDKGTEEEKARKRSLILPAIITQVFGIEAALKALIWRQGETPPKHHDLLKLYKMLAPETQRRIREKGESRKIRVKGVLMEHRHSFQEWRYRDSGGFLTVHTGAIAVAFRAVIDTYQEIYGVGDKQDTEKSPGELKKPPPGMVARALEYDSRVRIK